MGGNRNPAPLKGPISKGESARIRRLLIDIEREISKQIGFPIKIEETSLKRGSLISISVVSGDPSGILYNLLVISGIAAGSATAINQFQQAIVHYPKAKEKFPEFIDAFKKQLSEVIGKVLEQKKIRCVDVNVKERPVSDISGEVTESLEELSYTQEPGEGDKIEDS